jgi:hypothetical protein
MSNPSETLYPGESHYPANEKTDSVGVDWYTLYSLTPKTTIATLTPNTTVEHFGGYTRLAA